MNILFTTGGDCKYGEINSLIQMIKELKLIEPEIQINVALRKKISGIEDLKKIGCSVYIIPYQPFCYGIPKRKWRFPIKYILYGIRYIYSRIFAVSIIKNKLDMTKIDLIHSNSSREDLGAMLANKYDIPLIWHIREFGDLDFNCYSYRKRYIDFMNESALEFIAISKAVQKHWIKKGLDSDRFVQIYNGVKKNDYVKSEYPRQNNIIKFVMMGSLGEPKGQHHLIKAIALLDNEVRQKVRLDIVGDGSKTYFRLLEHLIDANKLTTQIKLLGYQTDFYPHLKEYDCGVMCSKSEGFGRVTAEYMMAGLPVIASDTGANPEIIADNITGLLYRYGDDYSLAEKIAYLVNNVHKLEEFGRNAHKDAISKYTAEINAANILKEYKKILKTTDDAST